MEYLLVYLIVGVVCGFVCMAIASSRNMNGGFWWGFWLGIIGIIIVAVRPNEQVTHYSGNSSYSNTTSSSFYNSYDRERREKEILSSGGWQCKNCGKVNFGYSAACECGCKRGELAPSKEMASDTKENASNYGEKANIISEADIIKYLKEYKELVDAGILTREEFEKKKTQLLENHIVVDAPIEEVKSESPSDVINYDVNPKGEKAVYPIPSDEYNMVLCPKCKTKQRANRHLCQKCGIPFMYEE